MCKAEKQSRVCTNFRQYAPWCGNELLIREGTGKGQTYPCQTVPLVCERGIARPHSMVVQATCWLKRDLRCTPTSVQRYLYWFPFFGFMSFVCVNANFLVLHYILLGPKEKEVTFRRRFGPEINQRAGN